MSKKISIKPTCRGFSRGEFTDANGRSCSIQISSAMDKEGLLWLGCNEIGLTTFVPYTGGWRERSEDEIKAKFSGPEGTVTDVLANTRMHLTQSQVKKLLPMLTKFAKTGEIS